jgi:glycerol-3-phosphate acyltransferase PlsY
VIGYAFGMIQTAYFYGKMKGIDIRKHGSGNAGTTNTLRVLGPKAGFTVLFGDMLKCAIAVWLVGWIFGSMYPEHMYLLKIYTAFGAILGHDFPFYMNFKGGKGIAAT